MYRRKYIGTHPYVANQVPPQTDFDVFFFFFSFFFFSAYRNTRDLFRTPRAKLRRKELIDTRPHPHSQCRIVGLASTTSTTLATRLARQATTTARSLPGKEMKIRKDTQIVSTA